MFCNNNNDNNNNNNNSNKFNSYIAQNSLKVYDLMHFAINLKNIKKNPENMIVRLQNEKKIIFNNKLKSNKNLYSTQSKNVHTVNSMLV